MAAFQIQAGRVEAGAARAFAGVANLIEKTERQRSDGLARLNQRLADIEAQMQKNGPVGTRIFGTNGRRGAGFAIRLLMRTATNNFQLSNTG